MVSQEIVNLGRMLALQGREKVQKLVGFIAAGRVAVWSVYKLLEDQVPLGIPGKLGQVQDASEIVDVPVQIAGRQNFGRVPEIDKVAAPAWRCADGAGGMAERAQKATGVGHGKGDKLNCTCRTPPFC